MDGFFIIFLTVLSTFTQAKDSAVLRSTKYALYDVTSKDLVHQTQFTFKSWVYRAASWGAAHCAMLNPLAVMLL